MLPIEAVISNSVSMPTYSMRSHQYNGLPIALIVISAV